MDDIVLCPYAVGLFVENVWAGDRPHTWEPQETFDGPGFWGHERLYLPGAECRLRQRMRETAIEAARRGLRAPPASECPWMFGELAKGGR
ncbi:hypothetical protein ACXYMO_18215 [Arenibacterium sp. CAU 1754]